MDKIDELLRYDPIAEAEKLLEKVIGAIFQKTIIC